MRFIFSGGGTGGHVYPALAILQGLEITLPGSEFLYIGSHSGIENDIIPRQNIPYCKLIIKQGINRRRIIRSIITAMYSVPKSISDAKRIIRSFKPDAVIGTGGYVSFPVLWAAQDLGIPTFIHEQNAWPGLTNKMLAKRAVVSLLTFPEAEERLKARKTIVTGLPVRPEIACVKKDDSLEKLGLNPNLFTVLIFGGSLGASSINKAALDMIAAFKGMPIQFLWITGNRNYEEIKQQLGDLYKDFCHLYPYLFEMELALKAADLAVCRCGAATLSELQIAGLPAIMIPYPYATENHQEKNGQSIENAGGGVLIKDSALTGDILTEKIKEFMHNPEKLEYMKEQMHAISHPDALMKIVKEIINNC